MENSNTYDPTSTDSVKATELCKSLASQLDETNGANMEKQIQDTTKELMSLDIESSFRAIKAEIGIEKICQYNLDEDPTFQVLLAQIDTFVKSKEEASGSATAE